MINLYLLSVSTPHLIPGGIKILIFKPGAKWHTLTAPKLIREI